MSKKYDGHGTRIILGTAQVTFLEKDVTPPGLEGGDPIDVTNNAKTTYREKHPRKLVDVTPASAVVEFDPDDWTSIKAAINLLQTITFTYDDGDADAAYGWLRSFKPQSQKEGAEPLADVVFEFAGVNSSGTEEGIGATSGTTTTT